MSFAIFYAQEGYDTSVSNLMGRNAAGASFLRGYLTYSKHKDVSYLAYSEADAAHFQNVSKKYGKTVNHPPITYSGIKKLAQIGGIYYPGPNISEMANYRVSATGSNNDWSICGITHTTSSANAMDALSEFITSPIQSWDALICTSNAVKKNVEVLLQARVNELRERLGLTRLVLPLLPVIPLGVHTDDFNYSLEERVASRSSLGILEDDIVVLYTGRLSFHAKAHPMPMYKALETAANLTNKSVVLIECGWHANEFIEKAFEESVKEICPSIRAITLDGRDAKTRDIAWSSADIFCSLSDNIQETFGIVPLEAMAARLPVVVSDWNGYKETVRHGIDGFRIPTLSSAPGSAGDIAHRHALGIDSYDMYCGHTSSLVAVNLEKLVESLKALFNSKSLRKKMGDSGREQARTIYDWRKIIPAYEQLWDEQTDIRLAEEKEQRKRTEKKEYNQWPARLDPTISFSNYPTAHLTESTLLTLQAPSATVALRAISQYKKLKMVEYAKYVFPSDHELQMVIKIAEQKLPSGCAAEDLIRGIPQARKPFVLRSIVWLCKLGIFRF